jgi:FkbM family methyltransferase
MLSGGTRKSFGLNQLDLKLAAHLQLRNGFFVEAGANDGISQSNTLHLEKYLGWRGLLIEAVPELAEKCRTNRPRCIVESCGLVPSGYPSDHLTIRYCNLMSVVKDGMKSSEEEEQHVAAGMQYLKADEEVYEVSVPARTLSELFDVHGVEDIDLLSLDVEGWEANALKGIDFTRHRPRYMLIEVRYPEDIAAVVDPLYERITELTSHPTQSDVLYRLR